jgi:autotransporter-associated beta strand protein
MTNLDRLKAFGLCGAGFLVAIAGSARAQLTTNDWQLPNSGLWTNTANWNPGVPNSATDVARFTADYAANFDATHDVNIVVNGIDFEDIGDGTDAMLSIRPVGGAVLTFDGTDPFVNSRSTTGGGAGISFYDPVDVGTVGLTKTGAGTINLTSTLTGSGTITLQSGSMEVRGNNATTFTGEFVANGGSLELRGGNANAFGSTDKGTTINGGRLRLRDLGAITINEPVTINGWNSSGSINNTASLGVNLAGAVKLNNNGCFSVTPWNSPIEPGRKMDTVLSGVISDDGNHRDNHFMLDAGSSANATGTLSRTSEFILSATNTWGGYTHITANRAADGAGAFIGTVRLANGNDRLPVTTTVILGGSTGSVGLVNCNGRLALAGYNQELAGLVTCGSGPSNQVVCGSATLSTLTMNVAAGTTNVYAGMLGGGGANENNLSLVSKGGGLLVLSGANTYTGTTTVQAGTLTVTGSLAGAFTVESGGTVAPGYGGIGTLSVASADLGGALKAEIDRNGGAPLADKLAVSGSLTIGGTLTVANIGGVLDLRRGDTFDLFDADSVSGGFDTVTLPPLSTWLAWDTFRLNTQGIIAVVEKGTLFMLF